MRKIFNSLVSLTTPTGPARLRAIEIGKERARGIEVA
jgi:hypothetical protein